MDFYCLYGELYHGISERIEHFKKACLDLNINFHAISSIDFDYSQIKKLGKKDLLYNISRGSEKLESLFLNTEVTTFYRKVPDTISFNGDTTNISLNLEKNNIDSPKTIYDSTNNKEKLIKYVDYLNGFPIVIKTIGGTLGIGTMIANDYKSIFSLTDYLRSNKTEFILREYINPVEVARLIVLGNSVIASNQKHIPEGDFRTSVKTNLPTQKRYSKNIESLAINATRFSNIETSGVDIIIDDKGKGYVLEVNMPHDFITTSKILQIDIAKMMLNFLISKANKTEKCI